MEAEKDLSQLVNDLAIENYRHGLNCAESVMDALIRAGVLDAPKEAVKLCIGFGAGIGLSGETCGALSAAILANCLVYGRTDPWSVEDAERGKEVAEKYYRRYNNIVREFIERNGCASCSGISSGYEDWLCKDRRKYCLKMIGATAQLAYKYLQISQEDAFKLPYGKNMRNMK